MKYLTQLTAALTVVAFTSTSVVQPPKVTPGDGKLELLILHNNDMHARFEQTSQLSGACNAADRDAGKCYGGFPRVAHVVKEARRAAASGQGPPVLYLNAGDTYTGTAWFTIYKWKIAAEFINALQPDAVSLGNHEFDEQVEGLEPFIRNVSSPVLAANLILDSVPEMQEEPNLRKSVILVKNDIKIGIIGYLTPDTKFLAPRNKVEYEDEVIAIRREVAKLKDQDVKILIALGHSGFVKDVQIAKEVEDLDLVIGGHSNTFLWNSNTTDEKPEYPQGSYPTWVTQASGRKIPVVQAYAYTKYIGKLHLIFDSNGKIIECDGTPILLNQQIPKDPELSSLIDKYRINIDKINNEIVGSSMVFLNGGECRLRECNMGNVITDAVLYYTKKYYDDLYPETYIAVVQGGRIRASISRPEKPPFSLTHGDWITVLPFSDTLCIVNMNGTTLLQTLEHAIDGWRKIDTPGQFLQVSGIAVTYDLAKPPGSRIVNAQATCSNCTDLADIQPELQYNLIMSIFLADNGDGYLFEGLKKETLPYTEIDCIIEYLKKYSPINPSIYGRIIVLNEDKVSDQQNSKKSKDVRESRLLPSRAESVHIHYSFISLLLLFICNVNV